jgi:hypothetical protein
MLAVLRATIAMLCFCVCVHAQTRTVAVYHSPAQPTDSSTFHEMHKELQRLLAPAAIEIVWQRAGGEIAKVATASFDGNCSVDEFSLLQPATGVGRTFGDTAVGQDWLVRPFFHVDCDKIVRTLRPSLDHLNVPMRHIIFGRALARVVAHELYHIVAQTMDHAEAGVAKPSFSTEDLIRERFDFSHASLERLLPLSAQKLTFTAN